MTNKSPKPETWEAWLGLIRERALDVAPGILPAERAWILSARLVYSAGSGAFGATHHRSWKRHGTEVVPVLSIEALVQEDAPQLAATLLHEMGHILAAFRSGGTLQGHNGVWRACCADLGLIDPSTYAKQETAASFSKETWDALSVIPLPISSDGVTANPWRWAQDGPAGTMTIIGATGDVYTRRFRCSDGDGVMGGKSRGTGSGSRWLSYDCPSCARTVHASGTSRLLACGGVSASPHDPAIMILRPSSLPPTRDAGFFVTLYPEVGTAKAKGKAKLDTSGANAPLGSLASIKAMPIGDPPVPGMDDSDAFLAFFFATMMPEPPTFDGLAARVLATLSPIGRITWPAWWHQDEHRIIYKMGPTLPEYPTAKPSRKRVHASLLADLEAGPTARVLVKPRTRTGTRTRRPGGTSGKMKRPAKRKTRK